MSGASRKEAIYATNEELPRQLFNEASVHSITQVVAQLKPKSPNRTCSEALTWRKQHQYQHASPLTNGAPPRRYSRRCVVLSRSPHTQMLQFVPISPLLLDQLSPQYLGFEIQMGLGYFLDINLFILVQVLLIYMDFDFFFLFFKFPLYMHSEWIFQFYYFLFRFIFWVMEWNRGIQSLLYNGDFIFT